MTDRDLLELIAEKIMKMDERMDPMEKENKEEFARINQSLARIEHDHGGKLALLFDGNKQHAEQLARIEKMVSNHEEFIMKNSF